MPRWAEKFDPWPSKAKGSEKPSAPAAKIESCTRERSRLASGEMGEGREGFSLKLSRLITPVVVAAPQLRLESLA